MMQFAISTEYIKEAIILGFCFGFGWHGAAWAWSLIAGLVTHIRTRNQRNLP